MNWLAGVRLCVLATACAVSDITSPVYGQAAKPPSRSDLDRNVSRLIAAKREEEALALIESFLAAQGADPQALFDAARIASRMGDPRKSSAFAIDALRAGWLDDRALAEHPDLSTARAHESWVQVELIRVEVRKTGPVPSQENAGRPTASSPELGPSEVARRSLSAWLARYGGGAYRVEEVAEINAIIASSVDRESLDRTIAMLGRLNRALDRTLFPPTNAQDDAVLLVIATPKDSHAYFGDSQQGGLYEHGLRQLVARDTGMTLRHEFTHARHHAHMVRIGQRHPLWIQEGIATLFEEWGDGAGGEVVLKPNLRTNEAYDLVRRKQAKPWAEFMSMDDKELMSSPIDHYAQARSMLMWLAEQGKFQEWYRAVVSGFSSDPMGRRAFETVFGAPVGRLEAQWRTWVIDQGKVDATIGRGDGVMGLAISDLPDGVRIDEVQEGGSAHRAGLRRGDVITQIDGGDIRSSGDFLLATAKRNAGESLGVRFRRGDSYATVVVRLADGHASPP